LEEETEKDILRFQYMINCEPQWLVPGQTGDNYELSQAFNDYKKGLEPRYQEYKKEPEYILPDYCAILRVHALDVELIPPANAMPRTLCKYLHSSIMDPRLASTGQTAELGGMHYSK